MSLDSVCAALCHAMGISPPEHAGKGNPELLRYIGSTAGEGKFDRVFIYNPDAIGRWIIEKYPELFVEAIVPCEVEIPLVCPMPSVTPVCFATMYSGAQPEVHGIRKYEKPVVKIETVFDALINNGKRAAIVAQTGSSMSMIFRERDMDYFIYDTIEKANAKAAELICEDSYDFLVVYNGNYDAAMHKFGPESVTSLAEARVNSLVFRHVCLAD